VGIPQEYQESIFEPFQQGEEGAAKGGIGLGLTIARKQVELMGGELACESPPLIPPKLGWGNREGVGSRFFFTLPLEPAKSSVKQPPTEVERKIFRLAEGYQVKALVADDNKENRDVLAQFLSDIGVDVITAENGQQAFSMVSLYRPDIVFMDIRMPIMDGIEATQKILMEFGRDNLKNPPNPPFPKGGTIVAISASTLVHERERYLSQGFADFIGKPFLAEQIYDCLARLLHVEYKYTEVIAKHDERLEFSKINLPYELFLRLKEAAEINNKTELESCLDEVEQLSEDGHRLSEYLRRYLREYNMKAILNVLSEIRACFKFL